MKRIVVLGATGSIGCSALDVVSHHNNHFEVVGLAAGANVPLLEALCRDFPGAKFTVSDATAHNMILSSNPDLEERSFGHGEKAVLRLIEKTEPDLVLNAFVGFVGLLPTLHCLENGTAVALANKESIVAGGEILIKASRASGAPIIPVDSEHVAIHQCIRNQTPEQVKKIYLTASGGALRDRPIEELESAGVEEVLSHPTWKMGNKITVDSATMLNKGLEVIEAMWLFDIPLDKIDVVIHPQSIVHSLVEFTDGSILAQMGVPDMRLPILYALSYPGRIESDIVPSKIDSFPELTFSSVDIKRYPCLKLALDAAERGGRAPTVLLAANEMAVGSFLEGKIPFSMIGRVIESALEEVPRGQLNVLGDIFEAAEQTRKYVNDRFKLDFEQSAWSWSC